MALEREIGTYEKKLNSELLAHEGQFVIIHDDDIVGFADSYSEALKLGYSRFSLTPFLVKRIEAVERVQFVPITSFQPAIPPRGETRADCW